MLALLWWDDDDSVASTVKIRDAAKAFKRKHKFYPSFCYVHTALKIEKSPVTIGRGSASIEVYPRSFILRDHFQVQDESHLWVPYR